MHGLYLLERLGLPETFPEERMRSAPRWFLAAHTDPGLPLSDVIAQAAEDPVGAERILVAMHQYDEKNEAVRQALEDVYVTLEWTYHLRSLQKMTAVARPYLDEH